MEDASAKDVDRPPLDQLVRSRPRLERLKRLWTQGRCIQHQGVELFHVTDGELVYGCGEQAYDMRLGDNPSFDSSATHGPAELKADTVRFVMVISKTVPGGE